MCSSRLEYLSSISEDKEEKSQERQQIIFNKQDEAKGINLCEEKK